MIWYGVLVALVAVMMIAIGVGFKKHFMKMDREITKESHQYVEGNTEGLMILLDNYFGAETPEHKAALLARIRQKASMMPEGTVPQEVSDLLAANPRGE